MESEEIVRNVWERFEPEIAEQGYELVEVELAGGTGGGRVLRMFIDKPGGGITIEDCVAVSQVVNPLLDVVDWIPDHYSLEVSSPGIDRPVRKPADFKRFLGEPVKLQSKTPVAGRKRFHGELKDFQDGLILVECDGVEYSIHIENLKKANLDR